MVWTFFPGARGRIPDMLGRFAFNSGLPFRATQISGRVWRTTSSEMDSHEVSDSHTGYHFLVDPLIQGTAF